MRILANHFAMMGPQSPAYLQQAGRYFSSLCDYRATHNVKPDPLIEAISQHPRLQNLLPADPAPAAGRRVLQLHPPNGSIDRIVCSPPPEAPGSIGLRTLTRAIAFGLAHQQEIVRRGPIVVGPVNSVQLTVKDTTLSISSLRYSWPLARLLGIQAHVDRLARRLSLLEQVSPQALTALRSAEEASAAAREKLEAQQRALETAQSELEALRSELDTAQTAMGITHEQIKLLLSVINHELNNILVAVTVSAELIGRRSQDPNVTEKVAMIIHNGGEVSAFVRRVRTAIEARTIPLHERLTRDDYDRILATLKAAEEREQTGEIWLASDPSRLRIHLERLAVLDDDRTILALVTKNLSNSYQVNAFPTRESLLTFLQGERAALSSGTLGLILDYNLGTGISKGTAVPAWLDSSLGIQLRTLPVPILLHTSEPDPHILQEARDKGLHGFMPKGGSIEFLQKFEQSWNNDPSKS